MPRKAKGGRTPVSVRPPPFFGIGFFTYAVLLLYLYIVCPWGTLCSESLDRDIHRLRVRTGLLDRAENFAMAVTQGHGRTGERIHIGTLRIGQRIVLWLLQFHRLPF